MAADLGCSLTGQRRKGSCGMLPALAVHTIISPCPHIHLSRPTCWYRFPQRTLTQAPRTCRPIPALLLLSFESRCDVLDPTQPGRALQVLDN
jgi:hypothetical protein